MRGGKRERIETALDHGAAAVFAGAVAFSQFALLRTRIAQPYLNIIEAFFLVAAFLPAARLLRRVGAKVPDFQLRAFRLPEFSFEDWGELVLTEQVELLLTDADRIRPNRSAEEELVLNDLVAKLAPDSRVVRLFDPAAMPTPAQLSARIERHLGATTLQAGPTDASEALYQALSELRRSLR